MFHHRFLDPRILILYQFFGYNGYNALFSCRTPACAKTVTGDSLTLHTSYLISSITNLATVPVGNIIRRNSSLLGHNLISISTPFNIYLS